MLASRLGLRLAGTGKALAGRCGAAAELAWTSEAAPAAFSACRAASPDASFLANMGFPRWMSSYPPHVELPFPSLSPTMTQGNLIKWYKKEGDEVAPGDVLADIETDKATMAFENQEDGFIAKLLVPDGANDIQVGHPVAILVEDAADVPKFASYVAGQASAAAAPASSPAAPAPEAPPAAASAPAPDVAFKLLDMPALSPTMSTGNLVSWSVKPGDEITPGTLLGEIETDKATLPFENQDEGFIASLLIEAGATDIPVGTPLAVIVDEEADIPKMAGWTPSAASASATPAAEAAPTAAAAAAPTTGPWSGRIGPAASIILSAAGISPSVVQGTGPKGIITKADALKAAANPPTAAKAAPAAPKPAVATAAAPTAAAPAAAAAAPPPPAKDADYVDIPVTTMRRVIASRLLESKTTIPAIYMRAEVELGEVSAMRAMMKEQGTKVSVNDFVVRAAALALQDVPEVNAIWDNSAGALLQPNSDISIAVATPGGLITPIVKAAEGKTLQTISAEVKDLAGRARENKLKPEEFMGGSFSISNLGMFGTDSFFAIINPPQACIMAVGGAQTKTVLQPDGRPASKQVMEVSISADNRAVDEVAAARFLEAFASYFASPVKLVM